MTESEAIKELKEDISLYDNEITRLDASIGTPDRNLIDALEMAINALEKQIPMKVLHSYDDSVDENWCSCPICCSGLGWEHGKHYKYCMNCGKKLDWSDEE